MRTVRARWTLFDTGQARCSLKQMLLLGDSVCMYFGKRKTVSIRSLPTIRASRLSLGEGKGDGSHLQNAQVHLNSSSGGLSPSGGLLGGLSRFAMLNAR